MNRLSSFVGVVSLTAVALSAQQLVAPSAALAADPSWTQNIWRETYTRNQAVYDTTHFTGQGVFSPIEINNIEYRIGATFIDGPAFYPNVSVWVGYAQNDHAALSTVFASNRAPSFPVTPNFVGPVTVGTSTGGTPLNDYLINIPLTTSFIYDPSLGQDLLVELYIDQLPSPVPPVAMHIVSGNSVATHRCSSVRVLFAAALTATGGTVSAFCPAVRFGYTIPAGIAKHDPYGTGCYSIANSFYEQFPGAFPASSNDLTNTTVLGSQNGSGGYDALTIPGATVVPPTGIGLGLADDQISAAIPLPFTFDYPGGSTSQIFVDSNGSIALNSAVAPVSINNSTTPATLLNATNHRLAASLQDLLPDGATNVQNVFAEVDPNSPNVFLITWLNVPCFVDTAVNTPSGLTSTFQIALIDNGTADGFEFRYQTLVNDSDSYGGAAVTGFSLGGGAIDGGNQDLTASFVSTATELGGLSLFGSPRPVLGNPVSYTLSNVRPNLGVSVMLASFVQIPGGLPLPLIGVNAPGCNAYVDANNSFSFGPLLFGAPSSGFSYTWPLGPWSGVTAYVQGFELTPGLNPIGVISSNGMKVELGTL
jgi:hypothetical protein